MEAHEGSVGFCTVQSLPVSHCPSEQAVGWQSENIDAYYQSFPFDNNQGENQFNDQIRL